MMQIKWRLQGFRAVRSSPGVQSWVRETADGIASRAGDGYACSARQGRNRYRAIVYADTWKARHDNSKNNTLLRVMG